MADLLIGKPGASVIAEAVQMNLPLLIERNRKTMLQEQFNSKWVIKNKVGELFKGVNDLSDKINYMLNGNNLKTYVFQTKKIKNNGVFELIDIIKNLL